MDAAKPISQGVQDAVVGAEYTPKELAYCRAVDTWLKVNKRRFASRVDHLRIAVALGYALTAAASEVEQPANVRLCMRCKASPVASARSELCVSCIEARFDDPARPRLVRGTCPACGLALVRLSTAPEACESCQELARREGAAP